MKLVWTDNELNRGYSHAKFKISDFDTNYPIILFSSFSFFFLFFSAPLAGWIFTTTILCFLGGVFLVCFVFRHHWLAEYSPLQSKYTGAHLGVAVVDHFYIVLFSALMQTHCAHMWFLIFWAWIKRSITSTSRGRRPFMTGSASVLWMGVQLRLMVPIPSSRDPVATSESDSTERKPCNLRWITSSGLFISLHRWVIL